jgi:transposase
MRKIKEVLRLKASGLSNRKIAEAVSISRPTVADYIRRARAAGISWPLPSDYDDSDLERLLFPEKPEISRKKRPVPDWEKIHQELQIRGVTLELLWQEYKETHPAGFQYSWFCQHYKRWSGKIDLVMRQEHRAGEKLFVDYAGQSVDVIDSATGEVTKAQIFVAVLGASNYTYAEATRSQGLQDWTGSHVRAFNFFGGVPEAVVPDNLKSGVSRSCRYEPDINPTYQDMATHYGITVLPARVRKPRDKAKVENGVLVVERWILACLRKRRFFSMSELNKAIRELLGKLNRRPFKKMQGCRQSHFEAIDKPALRPLPAEPYEFAEWKKAKVHVDYHVEVNRHFYSVPHSLAGKRIDIRITASTIECFHAGKRVASHKRSNQQGRHTTVSDHMPPKHRLRGEWTPERFIRWGDSIGPYTRELVSVILAARYHPEQAYRTLFGIFRLGKSYPGRLENACKRALHIGATSYRSVESILKNGLDSKPLPAPPPVTPEIRHENIRGPEYFNN